MNAWILIGVRVLWHIKPGERLVSGVLDMGAMVQDILRKGIVSRREDDNIMFSDRNICLNGKSWKTTW